MQSLYAPPSPLSFASLLAATPCLTPVRPYQMLICRSWVCNTDSHTIKFSITSLHLDKRIDVFLAFYRDSFPQATISPKLHMMEDHVVPFLQRWKVGFGFLGEEGAESIHARFNSIRKNFSNMPNKVVRLQAILNAHLTEVCPELIVNVKYPAPKKRNFKKPREV